MEDIISWFAGAKVASVLTATGGAALAVLLEFKRHTWATAALALASGVFVAWIASGSLVEFFNLPSSAENAVAGVLGISGRGLIVWVLQLSKDPLKAWKDRK